MTSEEPERPASGLRVDKVPLGILLMLGSTVAFSGSTALSKWQVAHYPFVEVLLIRAVVSTAICYLLILPRTGLSVFRTQHLGQHFGRSVTHSAAQSAILLALASMPIAGAMAINFSSPLFAALFAAFWLKERIDPARGLALVVGFGGVLLVVSPGSDSFGAGALFALANAVLFGSVTVAVRGMSMTESSETLTVYQMTFMTLIFAAALPFSGFVMPSGIDALAMAATGVFNGLGQYWWTRSLTLAPPSAVGPFYYFNLIWAIILGYVFWGDIPTIALLIGSSIVVISGLMLLWRESGRRRRLGR